MSEGKQTDLNEYADYLSYKEDNRPQRGWWAPGAYLYKCRLCKQAFVGDKRAMRCADCAYINKNEDN